MTRITSNIYIFADLEYELCRLGALIKTDNFFGKYKEDVEAKIKDVVNVFKSVERDLEETEYSASDLESSVKILEICVDDDMNKEKILNEVGCRIFNIQHEINRIKNEMKG